MHTTPRGDKEIPQKSIRTYLHLQQQEPAAFVLSSGFLRKHEVPGLQTGGTTLLLNKSESHSYPLLNSRPLHSTANLWAGLDIQEDPHQFTCHLNWWLHQPQCPSAGANAWPQLHACLLAVFRVAMDLPPSSEMQVKSESCMVCIGTPHTMSHCTANICGPLALACVRNY